MVSYDVDDVVREREAMDAITRALGTLERPGARQRVMRWAVRTFLETRPAAAADETAGAPYVEQEDESASNLAADQAAAEQMRGNEPLDELFREIAADFQRLALERYGA